MKISNERYEQLRSAIDNSGGLTPEATMRNRWDALWRSGFDVSNLYKDGLADDHIDTALRAIARR